MPLPAQERWAILAGIPKVVATEDAKGIVPKYSNISVDLNDPPGASVLTVPRRMSSAPSKLWYPYVAAADRSGLLLLCATQMHTSFSCVVSYHLCDAPTGKAVAVPQHFRPMSLHGDNVGLIRSGRDFMIAELRPTGDGSGRATLLCFTAGNYQWAEKELTYSPPLYRHWFGEGVVSHDGMLWWVDLSYGLLACDPFADAPELLFVPLPQLLDELPANPANRGVHRCVKVSGGRLRYVQIHGDPHAPVVTMWALADPASAGDWNRERSVLLSFVWADQSYLDTMLPQSIPALALLHPTDLDRVYFFLNSCIFAVDLRLKKVVEFNDFGMPDPPPHMKRSSHFIHAWQYDPSGRRDFLPRCFKQDKVSLGPEHKKYLKKYIKRFTTARSRMIVITPVTHDNGKNLQRFRDPEDMEMEEQQAKRMKLAAIFSEVLESRKKNLPDSLSCLPHYE